MVELKDKRLNEMLEKIKNLPDSFFIEFSDKYLTENYPIVSVSEVMYNLQTKLWDRSTKVRFKLDKDTVITTCGRIVIYDICGILIDYELDKNGINKLILEINKKYEDIKASEIINNLNVEFSNVSTNFGLSLCMSDMKKTEYQVSLIDRARVESKDKVGLDRAKVWDHYINKSVDDWIETIDKNNSLYLMMVSGARVTKTQIRQMIIAKGLLIKMNGDINENAVSHSLSDGLGTHDYFQTCAPARRGLANNFFIVPTSGYLERQLVNITRDFIIVGDDCMSRDYVPIKGNIATGRVAWNTCTLSEYLVTKEMSEELGENIIMVRSPLTCKQKGGLCSTCCGRDIQSSDETKLFNIGLGIGVIASQTIVEPATQLGLRGKHTSGATTIAEYSNKLEDALGAIMVAIGSPTGMYVNKPESPVTWENITGNNYIEKSTNLSDYIKKLFSNSGIKLNRLWFEIVIRAMSEVQIDTYSGDKFFRMDFPEKQFDFHINSILKTLKSYPSFDKCNHNGYVKENIVKFLSTKSYEYSELHSEKLMYGNLTDGKFKLK